MRPVGTPGTQLYDDDTTEPAEHTINNAKAYLRDFHSFNQRFIEHLRGRDSKNFPERLQNPIRVAVIDSGVSENDPKISAAIEQKRIVERKNWTESSYNDTYGHGTHVAKLFLTVAPNAKLYIAKVSENNKYILDTNLPTLGKAIDYAIDKWDVDIISISLGLDKSEPNIDAALDKALRPRGSNNRSYEKIVFAAASNEGARRACAFPARKPGVIRVNASDGNGGDIQRLSPGVDPNTENFVTLGINILSRWQGTDTLISGTSFATPIAAAIAADILELARFEVDIGVVEQRWLYSSKGMRAALKRYAEKVPGYRFLRPLESPEAVVQKLKEVLAVDFYV
ncbi:subtilisin-like protein [Viridothelium virens]|uniref:Subtilisin-like protein n=1 Tax=Viridothelium virens TaxID=1048519 RepID=A0A6A6GZI9_VIRVR|nr:subtilisin-like protein [Viridothelium virens]